MAPHPPIAPSGWTPDLAGSPAPLTNWPERVARLAGASAGALGACTLAGYWLAVPFAAGAGPALAPMSASTALFFCLAGVALYLAACPASSGGRRVRTACAAVALVIAFVTLVAFLFGQDPGAGPVLAAGQAAEQMRDPLAPLAFVCLNVLAVALLALDFRVTENLSAGHLLASVTGVLSLFCVLESLAGTAPGAGVSPAVAAGLLLLSGGTLLAPPRLGLAAVLASDGPGGQAARRLLPATLFSVAVAAALRAAGERIISPPLGLLLPVVLATVLVCGAIWWTAARLERDAGERRAAELDDARLIAILETTPDFVCTAAMDGRLVYLNPAARRMAGMGHAGPLPVRFLKDLCPRSARARIEAEALPAALRSGEWRGETALLAADGGEIPVSAVILAHWSPERGGTTFFSVIARPGGAEARGGLQASRRGASV